jgi:uncharacterized MAPEG superfamily protein
MATFLQGMRPWSRELIANTSEGKNMSNIPYYCLLAALALPYLISSFTIRYRIKQFGAVNAQEPRIQAAALEGAGGRCVAAQANAWEALLVFAISVFTAASLGLAESTMVTTALVFICARVLHAIFYISGKAVLRTMTFMVGFISCIWMMSAAIF